MKLPASDIGIAAWDRKMAHLKGEVAALTARLDAARARNAELTLINLNVERDLVDALSLVQTYRRDRAAAQLMLRVGVEGDLYMPHPLSDVCTANGCIRMDEAHQPGGRV